MMFLDNSLLLLVGLFGFAIMAVVGEICAKIFDWK